jgi:Spy/CpxP family protein refolding chaperone
MKKLFVLMFALLLLIGGIAKAQMPSPESRIKRQMDAMKAAITLTDDQTTKVTAIITAMTKSTDSLFTANQGGDMTAMREIFTKMGDVRNAKIKAVLTPEQQIVFEAKKVEIFAFRRPAATQ